MASIFLIPIGATLANELRSSQARDEIEAHGLVDCAASELSIQTVQPMPRDDRPSISVRLLNDGAACVLADAPVVEVRVPGEGWVRPTPFIVDGVVTNGPAWDGTFAPDTVAVMTVTATAAADELRADALRLTLAGNGGRLVRDGLDFVVGDQVEISRFEADTTDG